MTWNTSVKDYRTLQLPQADVSTGVTMKSSFITSDQSANRVGIETNINDHYSIYWDVTENLVLDLTSEFYSTADHVDDKSGFDNDAILYTGRYVSTDATSLDKALWLTHPTPVAIAI